MPNYAFQETGADWLASRRVAYLADDMGLGKTVQAIQALDRCKFRQALIICPAIMRQEWKAKLAQFGQIERRCSVSPDADWRQTDVAIVSYEGATKNAASLAGFAANGAVIIDEARALKEQSSQRTRAILGARLGVAAGARRVWWLDGTPAPNHPGELFTFLKFAGAWAGDYDAFINRFCYWRATSYGVQVYGSQRTDELAALLKPLMLRRTEKEAELELPPLEVGQMLIEPSDAAEDAGVAAELRAIEPAASAALELAQRAGDWSLGHVEHLSTIRRLLGLLKARAVVDAAREILKSEPKIAIYGHHKRTIAYIATELLDFSPCTLIGGMTDERRFEDIRRFQNPADRCRVVVGQNQAAGAGVTLTAARTILLAEPSFVPGENRQVIKRIHRIGQEHPARALFVTARGTLDEMINRILERKTKSLVNLIRPS